MTPEQRAEQIYYVSKKLDFLDASRVALQHFGSHLNFHCANNNNDWGAFKWCADRTKEYWCFIGKA